MAFPASCSSPQNGAGAEGRQDSGCHVDFPTSWSSPLQNPFLFSSNPFRSFDPSPGSRSSLSVAPPPPGNPVLSSAPSSHEFCPSPGYAPNLVPPLATSLRQKALLPWAPPTPLAPLIWNHLLVPTVPLPVPMFVGPGGWGQGAEAALNYQQVPFPVTPVPHRPFWLRQ